MLASTAMVAVLAGSLYAGLHIAFKAKDSAMRSVESVRKCEAAISLLKEDIQSAAGPNGLLAGPFTGGKASVGFASQGDTLSFYAAATDIEADTGVGDIKMVEFFCQPADDSSGNVIVRQVTTNLLALRTAEPIQETICRGVKAFTLRYFDGSAWQDVWDSTTQGNVLPTAVEVTIELNEPAISSRGDAGYRMTRVLLIPCGQAAANTASTGASSSTTP
jgi:hypothetical protein